MLPRFQVLTWRQTFAWVLVTTVGLVVICSHLTRTFTLRFKMTPLQPPRPLPEPVQSTSRATKTRHTDEFCHTSLPIYDLRRLKNRHKNVKDKDSSSMDERNIGVNEKNGTDKDTKSRSLSGSISNGVEGEVRHVMFSKVHKAASATTQGILLRFAVERNLSAMMPKTGVSIRELDDKLIVKNLVPPYNHSNGLYDILANHIIFNAATLAPHFPSDTVRFAFVRDPMKHALSALAFYTSVFPRQILKQKLQQYPLDPNTAFLNNPAEFFDKKQSVSHSFINNRNSVDLGIDTKHFEATKRNQSKICEFIRKMDRELDIVLVVEFYDESMVLLKRLLNWQLKDVLYMKVNTLDATQRNADDATVWRKKPVLTPENQKTFHQWAAIDYALHEHFSARFNKTIEQQPLFSEEVQVFKNMLNKVQGFCRRGDLSVPLTIMETKFSAAFDVNKHNCTLLKWAEDAIVKHARKLQLKG